MSLTSPPFRPSLYPHGGFTAKEINVIHARIALKRPLPTPVIIETAHENPMKISCRRRCLRQPSFLSLIIF